jgi:hypothetical protein
MLKWSKVFGLSVVLLCGAACAQNQSSSIEVSTVKPSDPDAKDELFTVRGRHFVTINTPVSDLIRFAYGLSPKQVEGGFPKTGLSVFEMCRCNQPELTEIDISRVAPANLWMTWVR